MTINGKAYIAGAFEHPTRHAPDKTVAQLHAEVALGALKDAGLTRADVDGYFCSGDAPGPGPASMAEYMNSRMIADPLRVLDCVMFCDGANAFLVMHEDDARARGLTKMARPKAYAEITNFAGQESCPDITQSGFSKIAPQLYRNAGMAPRDIRMFQPYDDFTIAVLMQMFEFLIIGGAGLG